MFVCCECRVLSGRGLCDGLISRPEESYRLWCVVVCDLENLKNEEATTRVGSQRYRKKKFLNCSTCFERHTAHHQMFKTVIAASGWVGTPFPLSHDSCRQPQTYVKPEAAITVLNSWWCAVCRSKHVKQLRNIGIINSTTRSHLVGYFYTIHTFTSSQGTQVCMWGGGGRGRPLSKSISSESRSLGK
jgi:hypothetical protein